MVNRPEGVPLRLNSEGGTCTGEPKGGGGGTAESPAKIKGNFKGDLTQIAATGSSVRGGGTAEAQRGTGVTTVK